MDHLKLDTSKMAEIVVNGEAFAKKARNTVEHLKNEFAKLRPESPQSREYHAIFKKEIEDIDEVVSSKLEGLAKVTEEMRQELEKLENSEELFSAARASMKESARQGKVKLSR